MFDGNSLIIIEFISGVEGAVIYLISFTPRHYRGVNRFCSCGYNKVDKL